MDNLSSDPLQTLLVDDVKAIDRQKLADFLKPFIFLNKEHGELNFTDIFAKLPNLNKLEVVFVADKARFLLFPSIKEEGLGQKEILALDIMPVGSVKSSLKTLSDTKKIIKNKSNKYCLPNYRLSEIFSKYEKLRTS